MGEERSSPRHSHIGLVPAATSCTETEAPKAPADLLPPPETIPDAPTMRSQLPTISRSLVKPVWNDTGRKGHGNLLIHSEDQSMNHQSTFQSDYVHHNLPPIPDLRPKVSALVTTATSAPFVPHTENRDNYAPFSMPKVRYRTRRGQIQIPKVPMESDSSYKSEYFKKVPERRPAYQPREQDYRPTEPFSSTSIYKADFMRWDSLPSIGLAVSEKPRPAPPSAPVVPVAEPNDVDADRTLNGDTDYRGNFQPWQVQRTATVAPIFRSPKEPFASETSYGNDFGPREKQPARTKLFKPPENDLKMKGPFEGLSLYQSDFIPKELRPPSRQIYENRSSITYPAVGRCGLETWYPGAETQPYLEHPMHVFYRA